jgi:hypothetical protein
MAGALFNGVNSKLQTDTATSLNAASMTILLWWLAFGQGGGNFGRALQADEATGGTSGNGWGLSHNNSANTMFFAHVASTTIGNWTFPASDNAWHAIALTMNRAAIGNKPAARVDFATATVTEIQPAAGTFTAPGTGYCIGNRSAGDRCHNGGIMHLQWHPVILSAADQDKALRYPGSVRTNGAFWWPLVHSTYTEMWGANGTTWSRGTDPVATNMSGSLGSSPRPRPLALVGLPGSAPFHLAGRVRAA